MDMLQSLQSSLKYLGINERDGRLAKQAYLFLGVQSLVVANTVFFLVDSWQDIDDRIIALKTIAVLATFVVYSVLFFYDWNEFLRMVGTFHTMNYQVPYQVTAARQQQMSSFKTDVQTLNRSWWMMVLLYLACLNVIPVTIVLIKVIVFSGDFYSIIKEHLSSPFPLYYPRTVTGFGDSERLMTIVMYAVGYSLHSAYTAYAAVLARLVYATALCSITNVEYELKLLTLSLLEMKQAVTTTTAGDCDVSLRQFFRYFIRHHQDTYRRFNIVDRGVRWIAATISSIASLYMCMSIYVIVQKDQIVLKIEETLFVCIWGYAIYMFDMYGERVTKENERLRNALYECPWLERPRWFNTSLLIVMTRSCKSNEMKPFGLFTLNRNNFAKTMNAAYSYYNLLYKFKGK